MRKYRIWWNFLSVCELAVALRIFKKKAHMGMRFLISYARFHGLGGMGMGMRVGVAEEGWMYP